MIEKKKFIYRISKIAITTLQNCLFRNLSHIEHIISNYRNLSFIKDVFFARDNNISSNNGYKAMRRTW